MVASLLKGDAAVGLSGYSEFSDALASGKLGCGRIGGAMPFPRLQFQGIDAVMANWRGVFTGKDVSPARTAELLAAVEQATHESWQQTLQQNRWEASWLSGKPERIHGADTDHRPRDGVPAQAQGLIGPCTGPPRDTRQAPH